MSILTLTGKRFLHFSKSFSDKARQNFSFSSVFQGCRQHLNLHIQKNSSMEKTFQKILLFYPFSQNDRKLSGLLAIVLACLSKQRARSSYNFFEDLKTTKKLKIFYPLCSLNVFFSFFDEYFLGGGGGGFKICLQRIRRKILNEIFFEQKICIIPYSYNERRFSALIWSFFGGFVRTASTVSRRTFWGKDFIESFEIFSSFLDFARRLLNFGNFFVTELCLNCILRVHKNIFKKNS